MTLNTFEQFPLPVTLIKALQRMKFDTPTPIQAKAIPLVLEGKDIIASAQTGSGKTAAFGIPALTMLAANPKAKLLVLAPTRELVGQIATVLADLSGKNPEYRPVCLIGGVGMEMQRRGLRNDPRVIVATPGRLVDFLRSQPRLLSDVKMLVLDEADRMLEMGFADQLEDIKDSLPSDRQTLLFSATYPSDIKILAKRWLQEPERIEVDSIVKPVSTIEQEKQDVSEHEKFNKLLDALGTANGSVLVFTRTKRRADKVTDSLRDQDIAAVQIHGARSQRQREVALQGFRRGKFRVMVATDIAARGIDVPEIETVVNYDLPLVAEDYLHRIGRTGRAGRVGKAICLVAPDERNLWRSIERLMARKEGRSSTEQQAETAALRKERAGGRDSNQGQRGDRNRSRDGGNRRSGPRSYSAGEGRGGERRREERGGSPRRGENRGNSFNRDDRAPRSERAPSEKRTWGSDRAQPRSADRPRGEFVRDTTSSFGKPETRLTSHERPERRFNDRHSDRPQRSGNSSGKDQRSHDSRSSEGRSPSRSVGASAGGGRSGGSFSKRSGGASAGGRDGRGPKRGGRSSDRFSRGNRSER